MSEDLRTELLDRATAQAAARFEGAARERASARMQIVKAEEREVALAEAFADGHMSPKAYRTAVQRVRTKIVSARSTIDAPMLSPVEVRERLERLMVRMNTLAHLHRTLDEDRRYQLVRAVFRRVYVVRGVVVSYDLQSPLDAIIGQDPRGPCRIDLEEGQVTSAISTFFEDGDLLDNQVLEQLHRPP